MRESESLINLKRNEWRVDLRKKQLNDYFKKRRCDMIVQSHIQNNRLFSEQQKCEFIMTLFHQFSHSKLNTLVSKIVEMDPTLTIFYRLTGFNPQSLPVYFQNMLSQILGFSIRECQPMYEQYLNDKPYTKEEKKKLHEVWTQMELIWNQQSKSYINIISLIKRVSDFNLLIREEIISFLSVVLNILLVFRKIASIIGVDLTRRTLVGQQKFMNYEIQSTKAVLFNILSGNDELLAPLLNDILQANGCNVQLYGLYFNMFLVKHSNPQLTLKILHYFIRLFEMERQYLLEDHKEIIYILYVAIKVFPKLQNLDENAYFVIIGQKLIKLLAGLLTIINMRFDSFGTLKIQNLTSSQNEDNQFLFQLAYILESLGTNCELIRTIMEQNSITLFLLNHLTFTKIEGELKILQSCLIILISAVGDHHSIHFFLNEEPRLLIKIQLLFEKYLNVNYHNLSLMDFQVLKALVILLRDLSQIGKVAEIFLQSFMLNKIAILYFRMLAYDAKGRFIKDLAEITYLKLVKYLRASTSDLEMLYEYLFKGKEEHLMLFNMLKYSPQKERIVIEALEILIFIAYSCGEVTHFPLVQEIFAQSTLISQLTELLDCQSYHIAEKAEIAFKMVNKIRNIRPTQSPTEIYDPQLQDV